MKQHIVASALFAGAMAAGAALAQAPVVVPPVAGTAPASRDAVKAEARVHNKSMSNTNTPAGEASTMRNNQPNMAPTPISGTTRAEVRQDVLKTKPQFGQKGERPEVPTNPTTTTGTPK
ncbi:MAG: serine/threonine protein kinase [Pseudomonadota bacterium]